MIKDFFKLAFKNLFRRKIRSWLTMVGIFIGIMAVVALISLGQGLNKAINDQFKKLGSDKIIVYQKGLTGPPGSGTGSSQITKYDIDIVKRVPGVEEVMGRLMKVAQIKFNDQNKVSYIIGFPTDKTKSVVEETGLLDLQAGRKLKSSDTYNVLVGSRFANGDIFKRPVKVGDKIYINNVKFNVVGIIVSSGNPGTDNAVIMTEDMARTLFNAPEEESMLTVKVKEGEDVNVVANNIARAMRRDRNLKEGKEDFEVQTTQQLLSTLSTVLNMVQVFLIGIAAISLIVGGIGIMNTMYTSVLERTKEIGVMKAIGAKNSNILNLFLIESGLLGMVGGAIGILLGMGLSKSVEIIATQALGTKLIQAYFPWYLIAGALMFSFLIGAISGITPALQAARMKPVDALAFDA